MLIKNQKEFDRILNARVEKCVEYISDKIYDCLIQHIDDDVYNSDSPNTWYLDGTKRPTFQFRDAFHFEGIKKGANEISNLLFYDWITMAPPNPDSPYLHGNLYDGIDRRSALADILNVVGENGDADFRPKKRNAFWDNTIKEIEAKFNGWAREAYNTYLK